MNILIYLLLGKESGAVSQAAVKKQNLEYACSVLEERCLVHAPSSAHLGLDQIEQPIPAT